MRKQTNTAQMIKTLEKELNKMEISNLSDAEFKTLVILGGSRNSVGTSTT